MVGEDSIERSSVIELDVLLVSEAEAGGGAGSDEDWRDEVGSVVDVVLGREGVAVEVEVESDKLCVDKFEKGSGRVRSPAPGIVSAFPVGSRPNREEGSADS